MSEKTHWVAAVADSRLLLAFGVWLLLALLSSCTAETPLAGDVVGSMGGEPLLYQAFEATLEDDPDFIGLVLESGVLSRLFDQFLDQQLLRRMATENGLGKFDNPRQLIETLLAQTPETLPDDGTVTAYYAAHVEDFQRPQRVRLSQILVGERDLAQQAAQALAEGEDFVAVAARLSEAPNAQQGGDQGWLAAEDLPPAFVETIFRLDPGGVTGIVEAEYGFHIFRVVDRQPARTVRLEEAAGRIREQLMRVDIDHRVRMLVSEARERYNVEIYAQNIPFEYVGEYATPK